VAAGVGVGEGVDEGRGVTVGTAGVSLGGSSCAAAGGDVVVGSGTGVSVGAGSGVAVGAVVSVGACSGAAVGASVSVGILAVEGNAKAALGAAASRQAARKPIPITMIVKIRIFLVFKCILYSL
jgi:hypothetical protein